MTAIVFGVATSLLLAGTALGIVVVYIEPLRRHGYRVSGWWYASVLGMFAAALAVSTATVLEGWDQGLA
jgi:hypothetical protein